MPRFLMGLVARFPLAILHALGALLGWAMYGLSPTYRGHLRANLEAAGYRDAATRRAAIAGAGRLLAELPAVWLRPAAEVTALVRRVDGREHVDAARAAGKGIVFLTPHLGCFEISAWYGAQRLPLTVLYRPPKRAGLEPIMRAGRARGQARLAPATLAGVRQLYKALRRGEAIGVLPDQAPGVGEGVWTDFFGQPAYTMTLVSRLQETTGAAVVMAFAERLPQGRGYVLHLSPVADHPLDPAALNRAVERVVRTCPGQYLWGYNRYKKPARSAE